MMLARSSAAVSKTGKLYQRDAILTPRYLRKEATSFQKHQKDKEIQKMVTRSKTLDNGCADSRFSTSPSSGPFLPSSEREVNIGMKS
jgi:hypothetical protein